jgi:hypothetical protein
MAVAGGRRGVDLAGADELSLVRHRLAQSPRVLDIERERVVVPAPTQCPCCGSARLSKLGESVTSTDGSDIGLRFSCATQATPRGLADAFIVGRDFVGHDSVALVLGDNIFYGHGLPEMLAKAAVRKKGAAVFGYVVDTPERRDGMAYRARCCSGGDSCFASSRSVAEELKPIAADTTLIVVGSVAAIGCSLILLGPHGPHRRARTFMISHGFRRSRHCNANRI